MGFLETGAIVVLAGGLLYFAAMSGGLLMQKTKASYVTSRYPYTPKSSPLYYGRGWTRESEWGPRAPVRQGTENLRFNYDPVIDFRGGLGPTNFW